MASVCASMGNTTARIAARLATSAWWMAVANKVRRVLLKLTNDARLVAAVGGAVGYFAEQAGVDARARADLITATEEACRDTFPLLDDADPVLGVQVEGFPDRIEVTLEHQAQPAPAAGLETFVSGGEQTGTGRAGGLRLLSRVDRVQYGAEGGTSRMTLVKYVRSHSSEK